MNHQIDDCYISTWQVQKIFVSAMIQLDAIFESITQIAEWKEPPSRSSNLNLDRNRVAGELGMERLAGEQTPPKGNG